MAYNFNPRERIRRTMKFDDYERLGMIKWTMVPIGHVETNRKYLTACGSTYQSYNDCLKKTLFDRDECKPNMDEVINC
jgi:hypothetical protein